ncbi:hypothetical protein OKW37_005317 [Paraburkholderia sp. MM5482-R2]
MKLRLSINADAGKRSSHSGADCHCLFMAQIVSKRILER